jgi:hypothetical protein
VQLALPLRKKPGTYWKGGWVGPRVGTNVALKRESCRESNPVVQPIVNRYSDGHKKKVGNRISTPGDLKLWRRGAELTVCYRLAGSRVINEVKLLKCNAKKPKLYHYMQEGAWGERRYSSYSFWTSALDGGEWSASRPGRALASGKGPAVPIVQESGWAPEPVWTQRLQEKFFQLCRGSNLYRPVVQPVARHYTDWVTRLTEM